MLYGALRNHKCSKLIDKIQYHNLDNVFLVQIYITALKGLHTDVHPSEKARAKRASSHWFGMWLSTAVKLEYQCCPFLHLAKAFTKEGALGTGSVLS